MGKCNPGVFLEPNGSSWKLGEHILAELLLLFKQPQWDCWQLSTGTGVPTHNSYSVMTSEKPVGTGNNEYSWNLGSAHHLGLFSVFCRTRASEFFVSWWWQLGTVSCLFQLTYSLKSLMLLLKGMIFLCDSSAWTLVRVFCLAHPGGAGSPCTLLVIMEPSV